MGFTAEHMTEAQVTHLPLSDVDNLLVPITQRRAPEAGHPLEITLALLIKNVRAFSACHHHLLCSRGIRRWVNHGCHNDYSIRTTLFAESIGLMRAPLSPYGVNSMGQRR